MPGGDGSAEGLGEEGELWELLPGLVISTGSSVSSEGRGEGLVGKRFGLEF